MPTYGYRCKSCGNVFEIVQSANEEPVKECPKCSREVSKIFYPVGIAFKGSGFHVNDYKSPKKISAEEKKTESENGKSLKAAGKTDKKDSECNSCAKAKSCAADK